MAVGLRLQRIDLSGQPGDFSRRSVLMENTFGTGLLNQGNGLGQSLSGTLDIFLLNSQPHLLNVSCHCGLHMSVSSSPLLVLPGSFDC